MALALEREWTKGEILEAYLNLAPFRGELAGLDAAARGLFGKAPAGLDARESALLVALLRGTERAGGDGRAARVHGRGTGVAGRALRRDPHAGAGRAFGRLPAAAALEPRAAPRGEAARGSPASASRRRSMRTCSGRRSRCCATAGRARRPRRRGRRAGRPRQRQRRRARLGRQQRRAVERAEVDGVRAPRQAGSTLKPFLYALASTRACSPPPRCSTTARSRSRPRAALYAPQNYDRDFRGPVACARRSAAR